MSNDLFEIQIGWQSLDQGKAFSSGTLLKLNMNFIGISIIFLITTGSYSIKSVLDQLLLHHLIFFVHLVNWFFYI